MLHKSVTTGFLRFKEPPALGHVHVFNNQIYTFMGLGSLKGFSQLQWSSRCAVCGSEIEVTTGLTSRGFNRRCEKHKKAWAKVKNEDAHALSQGWIPDNTKPAKLTVKRETGVRAHPLYPAWQAYVLAVPEGKRSGLLNWPAWLAQRESALD